MRSSSIEPTQPGRFIVALLGAALVAGCGAAKINHGPLPCAEVNSASCGKTCSTTADCGAGLYCATNSMCAADCTQGSTSCGANEYCSTNGQCVPTAANGSDGGAPFVCPAGLQCNVSCSGGTTTTISGKVYDPAGKNPLYNVAVYVPASPLTALPKGVPTGADACSCAALYRAAPSSAPRRPTTAASR